MSGTLERNLLALSGKQAELASRLASAVPEPGLRIEQARSGAAFPLVQKASASIALHSRYDPETEGRRAAESLPVSGFAVVYGLGAAWHILPLLDRPDISGLLCVESELGVVRAILERIDLSRLLSEPRFHLVVDPDPRAAARLLPALYIPALAGGFFACSLRARVELDRSWFEEAAVGIESALDAIGDDYSVQSHFGLSWFRNTVRNLARADGPAKPLAPIRSAIITAAGPSLELGIEALRSRGSGTFLIATDTSLPALTLSGIRPDLVISIDCQHISYYHFVQPPPEGLPIVLDLASPPSVARRFEDVRFVSSGHPFCRYLAARWRPFPLIDTSGGNVTYAALSLAEALGAESCRVYGADYAYPSGKSYARGTYIYQYFDGKAGRLRPLESAFAGFLFRTKAIDRETDERGFRYVTKPLASYRQRFEDFAAHTSMRIALAAGNGVRIALPPTVRGPEKNVRFFGAGAPVRSARDFLAEYRRDLAALALPLPEQGANAFYLAATPDIRDLWTTLLPAAAALSRGTAKVPKPAALLAEARERALSVLDEELKGI